MSARGFEKSAKIAEVTARKTKLEKIQEE